jgi:hypothetical protein
LKINAISSQKPGQSSETISLFKRSVAQFMLISERCGAGCVVRVVDCLPSKHEALSSNPQDSCLLIFITSNTITTKSHI